MGTELAVQIVRRSGLERVTRTQIDVRRDAVLPDDLGDPAVIAAIDVDVVHFDGPKRIVLHAISPFGFDVGAARRYDVAGAERPPVVVLPRAASVVHLVSQIEFP